MELPKSGLLISYLILNQISCFCPHCALLFHLLAPSNYKLLKSYGPAKSLVNCAPGLLRGPPHPGRPLPLHRRLRLPQQQAQNMKSLRRPQLA